MLGGSGHAFTGKMNKWCDMVHSEHSNLLLYQPKKSTTLRIINQQQQILLAIFFFSINPDVHVNKQLSSKDQFQ